MTATRAGFVRGWIELKQTLTTPGDVITMAIFSALFLAVMLWTRHTTVPGTQFSLGTAMLVSVLGMDVGFNGVATLGGLLTVERDDGTLLRAKAIPNGMTGYLIGKLITVSGTVLIGVGIRLITGVLLFSGLALASAGAWLTLIWVLLLGLLATLPLGALLGSLIPSARSAGLLTLSVSGIIAVSGIFYPITHLPHWLQWAGQAFPMYWLGLGMRSALLPGTMAAVEIGHSWRHLETSLMLAAWAVAGLALAPVLLRRVARRESGASVAARRERALRRMG
ncbi:MAG: ABC transporter permease [Streptosporangiaceae bacterium]|nr:ABC transporter permease [Streptosporangiaceae bacterium]